MADSLGYLSASDVNDWRSFANYCQQQLGTPFPILKHQIALKKRIKDFFEQYPHTDYQTLVRLVDWAQNRHKRPAHAHGLMCMYRYAWSDGCLPELDPRKREDPELEARIQAALVDERDPQWRRRLLGSEGIAARREVYNAWVLQSSPSLFHVP